MSSKLPESTKPKGKRLTSYNKDTLDVLERYVAGNLPDPRDVPRCKSDGTDDGFCYVMENPIVSPMELRPQTGYWAFRLFRGIHLVYEEGYHPNLGGYSVDFLTKYGICEVEPPSSRRTDGRSGVTKDLVSTFNSPYFKITIGIPYLFTI
jgi:hypothetical protein